MLAAAGVATVLAVAGGSGHGGASVPAGSAAQASAPQALSGHAEDTAYMVRRVSAKLDQAGQTQVVERVSAGGNGNPGSDSTNPVWSYTDPQTGDYYSSSQLISPSGTDVYEQYIVGTPDGNQMKYQSTNLNPVQQEYAVQTASGRLTPTVRPPTRSRSSPSWPAARRPRMGPRRSTASRRSS